MNKLTVFWMAAVCFVGVLNAQTVEQQITLREFSVRQDKLWHQQRAEAESLARVLNIPVRAETPGGGVIELQKIVDGRAYYYRTLNLNAAKTLSTNKVWPGGTGSFALTGSSDTLAIWDADKARQTHQEFGGRVIYSDAGTTTHPHSTHVAGTMIAGGVDANAKGMSYQARLKSYDWDNDQSEMAAAAAAGLRVSNHSYGLITGWYYNGAWHWYGNTSISTAEAYLYGFYTSDVQAVDNIAVNAPYYLIAKSAGNDRFDGPSSQPVTHSHSGSGSFTDTHDLSGAPSGYDCISDFGVAKNVLTVGAVNDIVAGYSVPGDVVMSSFSSWGPVDDGRIKPDIVGNGINVYSSTDASNTSYDGTYSGTSMATPNVSGSLGLLLQLRKSIAGAANPMRSSTIKGLVIHTADESGSNPGPDYAFGWGLMNTLKAAQVMRTDSAGGMSKNIRELVLSQGQTIDVTVNSDGLQALRATMCWIDPAGTPPAPALDPSTLMLVNDLDLRIIKGVTTYSPWVLNPASPSSAATTGDNTRDNVEQVHIASPSSGQHTVRITHKGTLSGGSQAVSLIITGGTFGATITVSSPNGGESWAIGSSQTVTWSSSGVSGNVNIDLSTNGGTSFPTSLFSNISNSGSQAWTVSGPVSSTARVRVVSVADGSVRDSSNANFSMVQPSITVIAPNGGESWAIGSSQTLTWSSANLTGNVKIELSTNGGSTFPTVIAASTANDNTEPWTVTGPVSSTARIRISSLTIPTVIDTSNASFSMVQPSITVTAPNGGESWVVGASQSITWSSANLTGNVKIELSTNGGSTFPTTLFASTSNDGTESWTVTGPATSTARIRISSLTIPTVIDTSNANFTIVQPTITVSVPNGGENWPAGGIQTITWTSSNVSGNVKIDLSINGGATFPTTLFASTSNDGTESWTVSGTASATCRIRISSVSDGSIRDSSNANFTISQPTITVSTPNGGETWGVGATQTIGWTSLGVSGNVKIELSRNGGGIYETLFASTTDDGTEQWVVTSPATSNALIRISSVSAPAVLDVSNGQFTISPSFSYLMKMYINDNGGEVDSLEFGAAYGATDGIDPSFGEYELPPLPPEGLDVRWRITGTLGVRRDIRDTLSLSHPQVIYKASFQAGLGWYPVVLRWNHLALPAGSFTLRDEFGGSIFLVNMKQQDSLVIADDQLEKFEIVYTGGESIISNTQSGWNMLSVPVTVVDQRKTTLFPTATSDAFAYTAIGYASEDTLQNGAGYWLKFSSVQPLSISGGVIGLDTIDVQPGWNLIGSISTEISVGSIIQIPSGIVTSQYFGYTGGLYSPVSMITPMQAYWVKTSQSGQLVLPASAVVRPRSTPTLR